MSITVPKSMPDGVRRPTSDEFKALVQWGIKQGLIRWPTPPLIKPEDKDLSPDLKREQEARRVGHKAGSE